MLELVILMCLSGHPEICEERSIFFTALDATRSCAAMADSYARALQQDELRGHEMRAFDCGEPFDSTLEVKVDPDRQRL